MVSWQENNTTVHTLGGMSYILYCFHWPVMEFLQYTDLLAPSLQFPVHIVILMLGLILLSYR